MLILINVRSQYLQIIIAKVFLNKIYGSLDTFATTPRGSEGEFPNAIPQDAVRSLTNSITISAELERSPLIPPEVINVRNS